MGVHVSSAGVRKSILVVDDIELNRTLVEAVLVEAGFEVDSVGSGAAAIEAVDDRVYDLVLMDLDMPGIDGYQAFAEIREKQSALPIVALTSRSSAAERERTRKCGMRAHVSRPIVAPALVQMVEELVAENRNPSSRVFCQDVQKEIVDRLGFDRTRLFLETLLEQCRVARELIDAGEQTSRMLDRKAHDLASTAGMLGYEELWHRCRDLLVASDDAARAKVVGPVSEALSRAMAIIEQQVSTDRAAVA